MSFTFRVMLTITPKGIQKQANSLNRPKDISVSPRRYVCHSDLSHYVSDCTVPIFNNISDSHQSTKYHGVNTVIYYYFQ